MATIKIMKELSIEEKARRYDEAIEKAGKIHNEHKAQPFDVMLKVFPELKESEGEKTKRLLHTIAYKIGQHLRDIFTEEEYQCFDTWSYAWLEAQGEQRFIKEHDVCDTCEEKASCVIPCPMKLVGQKPTDWNEDDENNINSIVSRLEVDISYWESRSKTRTNEDKKLIEWLKFLKDRYTWKPSDEQITWLYRAADDASKDSRMKQVLNELLSDLKKLRGE